MPHLNELQEALGEKGLTIIGVTGENTKQTEPWIEKHRAEFGYAYDKRKALQRSLGVGGIPYAVLVDPAGTIVWRGHPGNLKNGTVKEHLDGSLPVPVWEWPDALADARKAMSQRNFGEAFAAAAEAAAEDSSLGTYRDQIQKFVRYQLDALAAMVERGDFLGVQETAPTLKKELDGLPEVAEVEVTIDAIKDSKEAKAAIKIQKRLAKIKGVRIRKKTEARKVLAQLEALIEKHPDGFAAVQAHEYAEQIRGAMSRLR